MVVGVDLDGTIDSDPVTFGSLMQALRAAGHQVAVLTGAGAATVTERDVEAKRAYLHALGLGHAWDTLVVFPEPPAEPKAQWCRANRVSLLIDNDLANARDAAPFCTVLLPVNSVEPRAGLKRRFRPDHLEG